jgi:hypothetical protein
VLDRSQPYQLRDPDGHPITARAAKTLIAEQFTVPDTVRARARAHSAATHRAKLTPLTRDTPPTPYPRRLLPPTLPPRPHPSLPRSLPSCRRDGEVNVQRPQADVARRPPRTNDVDLNERRHTTRQRGRDTPHRRGAMTHAHTRSPAPILTSDRESLQF